MGKDTSATKKARRPRFRRAENPPAFQITSDDIGILRHIAQHRFLRSSHIAVLTGRSIDRINDRLLRLFHAGLIDRPRAQLDYYPDAGSSPIAYAIADRGARLLAEQDRIACAEIDWSRKNREAKRPFIEHQLEVADFEIATRIACDVAGYRFIDSGEIIGASPIDKNSAANTITARVQVSHRGRRLEVGIEPDLVFALALATGARRNFLVEIDRGTMPVTREDFSQSSIERKLRCYLAANAARIYERRLKWRKFRVLFVTTEARRMRSMLDALRRVQPPGAPGSSLFMFTTREAIEASDPLAPIWHCADGHVRALS